VKGIRKRVEGRGDLNRTAFRIVQDATRETDRSDAPEPSGSGAPETADYGRSRDRNGHATQK